MTPIYERRAEPRVALERQVEMPHGFTSIEGTTIDLSEGGIRVSTETSAAPGTDFELKLTLPTCALIAHAVVRHASPGELALEFTGLSHVARSTLTGIMGQRLVSWG